MPAVYNEFPMNKKPKEKDAAFDAFPMNKRETGAATATATATATDSYAAFSKVKRLPEMDGFSKKTNDVDASAIFGSSKKPSNTGGFDAFSKSKKNTESSHEFPMSRRSSEDWPPREQHGNRSSHLVFEPMTYGGALVNVPSTPAKTPTVVVISGHSGHSGAKRADEEKDESFAAKFANKMKITDDPTVVDMESEQDFPTLGGAPARSQPVQTTQQKTQTQQKTEWTQSVQPAIITAPNVCVAPKRNRAQNAQNVQNVQTGQTGQTSIGKKIVPVIPRRIQKRQEESNDEGEYKPIEYEEDAFDEDLDTSDLDEDALFVDEEGDEGDDQLDPNVYENRRHPEDI